MPWQPKSSAPVAFNLGDELTALVTGDATLGWLISWIPLIGSNITATAPFCANGPPENVSATLADFVGTDVLDAADWFAQSERIANLIRKIARMRVFSALCENTDSLSTSCPVVWTHSYVAGGGKTSWTSSPHTGDIPIPHGTTNVIFSRTGADCNLDAYWHHYVDNSDDHFIAGQGIVQDYPPGQNYTPTWPATGEIGLYIAGEGAGVGTLTVRVCSTAYATTVPTSTPMPTGLPNPLETVPATLAGIAAESAKLELKLDTMMNWLQGIAGATLDLGGDPETPVALAENTPLDVTDAVGCVIAVSGIPASRSLDFGTPQNIVKLGIVNLGTSTAWYPSIRLTHTPMIIRPFPPSVTRVTVTDLPPGVTATIALIAKQK